jgi:Membrane protein involved in the export of O-antigen and teichoic acid
MGVLKRLASETAIYGMSTILARIINYFFVPIYTRVLTKAEYGSVAYFMAYIAVLQVVLTLGLETGCFKFANNNKDSKAPFSTAFSTVFIVSAVTFFILAYYSNWIANLIEYEGYKTVIIYVGGILALDSITSILFARLRFLKKALKFATIKSIKILSELGFNVLLLFGLPAYFKNNPDSVLLNFIPATPDFSYIILAILLSCIVCTLLLLPDIFRIKFSIDKHLWKQMMIYSIPIMVAGLPGILNELLDRVLFTHFSPQGSDWQAELGVYQASIKLAVIMNLFIQMFRYAAEPFFFEKDKGNKKEMLAKVMEYFVAFCTIIFLGVTMYIDVIGLILGKDFRGGLAIVPYALISYMILGVMFNVSMWYKLSGQTKYAIYITSLGLLITVVGNVAFMPIYSYWASVITHLVSCAVMLAFSVYLGNKHNYIPYNWRVIGVYFGVGLLVFGLFLVAQYFIGEWGGLPVKLGIATVLMLGYLGFVLKLSGGIKNILKI